MQFKCYKSGGSFVFQEKQSGLGKQFQKDSTVVFKGGLEPTSSCCEGPYCCSWAHTVGFSEPLMPWGTVLNSFTLCVKAKSDSQRRPFCLVSDSLLQHSSA